MAGYRPRRRADQSQPQVARVWLLVISHPAAMYSRCSGIQLVTLLHVIPSEFFLSSFFLSSFFLILSTLTAQLNKQKELECDECTACYVHGFYWGKDRNIVDLILDGCWFKFPIWREKSPVTRLIVKNLFEAWDVNSCPVCLTVHKLKGIEKTHCLSLFIGFTGTKNNIE